MNGGGRSVRRERREAKKQQEKEEEQGRESKRMKVEEGQGEGEMTELRAIPEVQVAPTVEVITNDEARSPSVDYEEIQKRTLLERVAERFESVKSRIMEFESMREEGKQKKTYLNDFMKDVGKRVDGSIHKTFYDLKSHMWWKMWLTGDCGRRQSRGFSA